jgi:hypothetical protein
MFNKEFWEDVKRTIVFLAMVYASIWLLKELFTG